MGSTTAWGALCRAAGTRVFEFVFDLGDSWRHRCTVLEAGIDPSDEDGNKRKGPVAVWGWGAIPGSVRALDPGRLTGARRGDAAPDLRSPLTPLHRPTPLAAVASPIVGNAHRDRLAERSCGTRRSNRFVAGSRRPSRGCRSARLAGSAAVRSRVWRRPDLRWHP